MPQRRPGPHTKRIFALNRKQSRKEPAHLIGFCREAEAEREKRAKVIHAEGELLASEKLAQAAEIIAQQPVAIQLRYLQTLTEIGVEKNTTVVFPVPMDIFQGLSLARKS